VSRSFAAAFRVNRAQFVRYFWQSAGLTWVTAAILVYPIVQANREREAWRTINRLGGHCHVDDGVLRRMLPKGFRQWCGLDSLHSIRTINLSHRDVSDADLEKLMCLRSLQQINLCGCPNVTTEGVAKLQMLPQIKLVWVDGMTVEDASRCLMEDDRPSGTLAQIVAVVDR
jgi:hypothetical protein